VFQVNRFDLEVDLLEVNYLIHRLFHLKRHFHRRQSLLNFHFLDYIHRHLRHQQKLYFEKWKFLRCYLHQD
jgi:hypothetical protein